jgi:catechol 2,3-dioxygenase-like lactoylglutathione lyase family enzyme
MHIGLSVEDLDASVEFYTRLFGEEPTLRRDGYVKWMLDDPLINFAINTTGDGASGVSHLGIQVTSNDELDDVRADWDARGFRREDQDDLVCGYQLQDKSWVFDPQAFPWEVFVTHGVTDEYGTNEMPDPG